MIVCDIPTRTNRDGWVESIHPVTGLRGPDALRFSVSPGHGQLLSARSDHALLGLLVPAMEAGQDLRINGIVSAQLLGAAREEIQTLLLPVMPHLRRIRIEADRVVTKPEAPASGHRVTGFSAGIDSIYTLLRERADGDLPPTLLFNANVGGHGESAAADTVFRARLGRTTRAAARLGLPLVGIDSNLREFHGRRCDFMSTHVLRNATAAVVLQAGARAFECSGSYHRVRQVAGFPGDISRTEAALLPLLGTEGMAMRVSGDDRSRPEKMVAIVGHPVTAEILDVCTQPRHTRASVNCGRCRKCRDSLNMLDALGETARFGKVFDLELHRRLRWWAHALLLSGTRVNQRDIRAFCESRGHSFSRMGRLMSRPYLQWLGRMAQAAIARLT